MIPHRDPHGRSVGDPQRHAHVGTVTRERTHTPVHQHRVDVEIEQVQTQRVNGARSAHLQRRHRLHRLPASRQRQCDIVVLDVHAGRVRKLVGRCNDGGRYG